MALTHTRLVRAFEATLEDLLTCQGVLFGTPGKFWVHVRRHQRLL